MLKSKLLDLSNEINEIFIGQNKKLTIKFESQKENIKLNILLENKEIIEFNFTPSAIILCYEETKTFIIEKLLKILEE